MVAPFLPKRGGVTVQSHLLVDGLEREGAVVRKVDTILHKLDTRVLLPLRAVLQPVVTAIRFLRNAPKCDVVHIHACSWWGFVPVMVCAPLNKLFTRKRLVISFHGGAGRAWLRQYSWLVLPFFRMADEVVVVSPQLQQAMAEKGIKSEVLWNLVDLDRFSFRARKDAKPNIAWIRHLEETYDPITALKVFERVRCEFPDATITFIGDGSLRKDVERYIEDHKLTGVRLTGRLPNQEVPGEFDKADIFLNTSRIDGMPTALLEAAAAGFPIVTTDAGGIPYIFDNGINGIVVSVGDVDALSREVIGLIRDPARAAEMSMVARRNAERFGWPARAADVARLYGVL